MIDPADRARIDRHLVAARARFYRTISGGIFEVRSDWMRGFSGVQIPVYNIFQPLTPTGLTDDTLADTAAFFSSREVLYAIELVHDRLPGGPDFLDQRHYQSLPPQPAMFLKEFTKARQIQPNPAVVVERVRTVPSLTAFCTLLHQVFDFPLSAIVRLFPVAHLDTRNQEVIRHYLAFLNEQPVGAGTMICLEGVASIGNLCTSDDYRQQGVATTLLAYMMNEAFQSHHHLLMLYSTPQAYQLFTRFGFEIYTQRQWFLPPGLEYPE